MKYPHFRPCAGTEREYSIIAVYAIITHKSRNAKLFLQNFAEYTGILWEYSNHAVSLLSILGITSVTEVLSMLPGIFSARTPSGAAARRRAPDLSAPCRRHARPCRARRPCACRRSRRRRLARRRYGRHAPDHLAERRGHPYDGDRCAHAAERRPGSAPPRHHAARARPS